MCLFAYLNISAGTEVTSAVNGFMCAQGSKDHDGFSLFPKAKGRCPAEARGGGESFQCSTLNLT